MIFIFYFNFLKVATNDFALRVWSTDIEERKKLLESSILKSYGRNECDDDSTDFITFDGLRRVYMSMCRV